MKRTELKLKVTRCKECREMFVRRSMSHVLCGREECGIAYAVKERARADLDVAKAERVKNRARREAQRPLAWFKARAQAAVNKYVRMRDAGRECVSCGIRWAPSFQAGHYISVGHGGAALRYELDNLHGQCRQCNLSKGGNAIRYRQGLVHRIGKERVEWLEGPHPIKKWTREELTMLWAIYKAEVQR